MRTPKEWSDNLKGNIITEEMLDAALYSVNKRAKNCRDQKREYRHTYDTYHNAEKYQEKESEYYAQKERLLSVLKPMCIHREHLGFDRMRHYETEPHFMDTLARCLASGKICWSNSFVSGGNRYYGDWYNDFDDFSDTYRTYFFDELQTDSPKVNYYLFYAVGEHSYHSPLRIPEENISAYAEKNGLEIVDIDQLDTRGEKILDLCSTAFVAKVIAKISSKEYQLSVRDPHTWYQELPQSHAMQSVSDDERRDNIYSAVSFGWSEDLSNHVMHNIDCRLPKDEKYKDALEKIQDNAKNQLRQDVIALKPAIQSRLRDLEEKISSSAISKGEKGWRRQRKLLNKYSNHVYQPEKDLGMRRKKNDYDIVLDFFEQTQYSPVFVHSVSEFAEQICLFFGPDHLPDAVQEEIAYKAKQSIIGQYERKFLSDELHELKRQKKRIMTMYPK